MPIISKMLGTNWSPSTKSMRSLKEDFSKCFLPSDIAVEHPMILVCRRPRGESRIINTIRGFYFGHFMDNLLPEGSKHLFNIVYLLVYRCIHL